MTDNAWSRFELLGKAAAYVLPLIGGAMVVYASLERVKTEQENTQAQLTQLTTAIADLRREVREDLSDVREEIRDIRNGRKP